LLLRAFIVYKQSNHVRSLLVYVLYKGKNTV